MELMKPTDIKYLVIHCSGTRSNRNYPLHRLEQDHQSRGFRTAGYHYYIRRSGEIHPLREHHEVGAHAIGYNDKSLGICYEGGISPSGSYSDTRTWEQRQSLRRLLWMLRKLYPTAQIVGHRDLSPDINKDGQIMPSEWVKLCPCFDVKGEYQHLREWED